jgi:hypothetical protein
MIPLSKILFFVLLIILLVLVALLITSLAGGFSRRDESNMYKKQFYNYPVENYNYSGGRQKSLKYGGAPLNLVTVFEYNNKLLHTGAYKTENELIIDFIFKPKPTFIYGEYCDANRGTAPIVEALRAAAAPPKDFNISFQDSTLLNRGINDYNVAILAAFTVLRVITNAATTVGDANSIVPALNIISDQDVNAVTNLHAKMDSVFNSAGIGSFELLVTAKTRYDAAITNLAPQITLCYDKCAEVTAAIAVLPPAVPTAVCNAIEAHDDIDPLTKYASDNTILPILAEHHGNLAGIERAHIHADNFTTGGGRLVLAAPAIGTNAAGASVFDQTVLQRRTAAVVGGANAYITAVDNKHKYINLMNLAAYAAPAPALDANVVRSYNGIHTFLNTGINAIMTVQALITDFDTGGGAGAGAAAIAADAIIGGGTPMQDIYVALTALNTSYTGGAYRAAFNIVEEINTDNAAGNAEIAEIYRLLGVYNLDFSDANLTALTNYLTVGTNQNDAETALGLLIADDVAAAAAAAGAGVAFVRKLYTANADISTNLMTAVNNFNILYSDVITAIQTAKTTYAMFDNSIPIVNDAIATFNGSGKNLAEAETLRDALYDNYHGLLTNHLYERADLALEFGGHIANIYNVTENQIATAGGAIVAQPINDAIKIYTDIRAALNPVTALNASLVTFAHINHNIDDLTAIATAITTFNGLAIPAGMHVIGAIAGDIAALTTLGTNITAYIAAAVIEITRIVTTYKGQLGIYAATAGSADITTAINTYIDNVIVGDATTVGLSLDNTAFLAKLDDLDAAIKTNEQNAMFYAEIAGVANPAHIHQLVTDIATAKVEMNACDFATLIPAYKATLNDLNDAIYECYNIFEVIATAAAPSPAKTLHQAIYDAGAGYYHAIDRANDSLLIIGETGAPNPYTATFTDKDTITAAANLALTAVRNDPRTIEAIAAAGSNDNITLIKVDDVHYFGYNTLPNTYIISYKIRELINAQLTPPSLLGAIGALSNTFTINDAADNAFTIGANLKNIKDILESKEIIIHVIAPINVLYVGNTAADEYIFWDATASRYREYAINSIEMFNLEVTAAPTDITKKIRFVNTATKIAGNLDGYHPTEIISMATGVAALESTPYKVFTHKDAADAVYEIDSVLYESFNSAAAAPTIRISPIITDTGAGIIDATRIKDITYGADFLNNLKRMADHNYYHSANDLTVGQFINNFKIHDIDMVTGILKDNMGADINIDGSDRNIYQILFYQPLLNFSSDAATITGFSNAELGRAAPPGSLNHNYRIHIDNIAKTRQESYFGLYDVVDDTSRGAVGDPAIYHHKMYISSNLPAKPIGGGDPANAINHFSTYQHNLIYTFEKFKENAAAADNDAEFIAQMNILTGHILYNAAADDEKVAILYYNNATREFTRNASDMADLATPILLYDLYCINNEYINITTHRGFDHQEIFILDNAAEALTRTLAPVAGGADPTHVKKYAFSARSYYLYSSNALVVAPHSAHRHRMTRNTLNKLLLYSIEQTTDINPHASDTDKLDKFLENIDCTAGNLIDIATAPFLNTIRFRYNIIAATIKAGVDAPAKTVNISLGGNHYDTMIDNCYHVLNLAAVANINSIITSDNKRAFCQLNHGLGIIFRSDHLNTYSNFLNENLSSIEFLHEDMTDPPAPNREKTSIVGAITLRYKTDIATVYVEINLNDYLGCGCIGFYNKGGANWHTTGGIVHYDAAHNIKIFDDNANIRNFINAGTGDADAANFAVYDVSLMNTILDNNRPEQKVIFYTSAVAPLAVGYPALAAAYPAIDHTNCNAIIPLQSDKDNTPFEDTEFHYYFGRYDNNKYYLSERIGTYMIAARAATGINDGAFANLKNLRIDHLIKKYKTPNSPLLFKEYGLAIRIEDVRKIIKQYMVCEYLPAVYQLFVHGIIGDIEAAAGIDAIPVTGALDQLLSDMRIPVPRIEPYDKDVKYASVPYNATIPKPRAITHELRINNYMGGNLSFFGEYQDALAIMTANATSINSRIFRYSDNIEYNRIIKAAFMMHRPYQIYDPPAIAPPGPTLLAALHPDPLKYVWISGELSINLDGLSPFSAFNGLNTLSVSTSPTPFHLTDVILYTTATEVLESEEALLRIAPSVKEPEPIQEIVPEPVYTADIHVQKQKALEKWISQLNMDSGKSHLVDTDGKTIPNDSNSRHNHPGATQVATIQIKEVEIVKSEREYKKIQDNYIKEVNNAKKHGRTIPKAKIYIIPSSKDWLRHQKNKKTYSLVDKNGNLDLSNIPNGKYIYNGAVIEF